jgi:hypothetical protein
VASPPLTLFVNVISGARSRSRASANGRALSARDQTSRARSYSPANSYALGGFALSRLRIVPVPVAPVGIC